MLWLKRNKPFLLLIVLLSLPVIFPLLSPGFFSSDDGEWMIIRFSAFHQALVDGQFPVRMLTRLNHEYGYPVANFLYPGFMYLAEGPKALGFGFVDSIKIILGLSMIASSVFTYLWLNKIFDKLPALMGALFYLYVPYHLYDLYKRGSVGEVLALAVVPFILWSIERKSLVMTPIGVAMLILSHNTLALLFLPIIILYTAFRNVSSIKYQVLSIALGLELSAFFWVPAILDLQHTRFFQTKVSNWQEHFADLPLVGFIVILIFITTLILFVYSNKQSLRPYRLNRRNLLAIKLASLFFIIGVVATFLSLSLSIFLWNIIPISVILSFIQFPFRFLSVTIVCATFLTACIISFSPKKLQTALGIVLVFLTVLSSKQFMTPQQYFDKGEGFYATNMDTTTVKNEYMPKWVLISPTKMPEKLVEFLLGSGSIKDVSSNNKEISFTVETQEDAFVRINRIFFPGFVGFVNGQEHVLHYDNPQGVIDIGVPRGKSEVLLAFKETRVRLIADFTSVAGIIALGLLVKRSKKNK